VGSALCESVTHEKFQLSVFVAAQRNASAIVTLYPELRATKVVCEIWHELQRGRRVAELDPRETSQMHLRAFASQDYYADHAFKYSDG
jgi:hypothetical protein